MKTCALLFSNDTYATSLASGAHAGEIIDFDDVLNELEKRKKQSGIEEKKNR